MNWNKVLSIFILLFLLLNGVLYFYREGQTLKRFTISGSRLNQLEKVMKEKGVAMYAFLPDYYPKAGLELKVAEWKKEEVLSRIFEGQDYQSEITMGATLADTYQSDTQLLSFYTGEHSGTLYYRGRNARYIPESLTLQAMEKKALQFVKDLTGNSFDFQVTNRKSQDGGYLLDINGVYRNEIIFSSYFQIRIDAEGVREAAGKFYEPIDWIGEPRDIYAFDEVMYYFMNTMEEKGEKGIIIKDADVGYFILDPHSGQLTTESVPVYRIILEGDERLFYIDAYQNEFLNIE